MSLDDLLSEDFDFRDAVADLRARLDSDASGGS